MNPSFKTWLIENDGLSDSAANSRVANILNIEKYYGDLDELIRDGGAQNLLTELSYCKKDERQGIPQKHKVPIRGNIYDGSATLRQAVKKYFRFSDAIYGSSENLKEIALSHQSVDEGIENEDITSDVENTCNSLLDVLKVSRMEVVHTNFLKWFFDKSKKHPIILKHLLQSIINIANNEEGKKNDYLDGCQPHVKEMILAENSRIYLDEVKQPFTCKLKLNKKKGYKSAFVDLVVEAHFQGVKDEPIKIIFENKVFTDEDRNQTKSYAAYFKGIEHEVTEYNLKPCQNNKKFRKGKKKNKIKMELRYPNVGKESQLFVFMYPNGYDLESKAKNRSEYFIPYKYQSLLDDVILPSLEDVDFVPEERSVIVDYVGMLIKRDCNRTVMAVDKEGRCQKLLERRAADETHKFAQSQKERARIPEDIMAYTQLEDTTQQLLKRMERDEQIRKVERRVPGWKRRPYQVNTRILSLFMELSDNGKNGIFLDLLEDEFDSKYPEERGNFTKNYNQMKNFGVKNHAKVFSEDAEKTVWLWEPVKEFIIKTFSEG